MSTSSGTSWEECSAYIYGNSLEIASWRQQKDKIIISLKGNPMPTAGLDGLTVMKQLNPLNDDPKTKLNQFCQRKCKSIITKNDVIYTTEHVSDLMGAPGYQSSVTLNCLEGISFAGAVCSDKKSAEKSAASEALTHYADEIDLLACMPSTKKRKTAAAAGDDSLGGDSLSKEPSAFAGTGCDSPKSQLNQALSKLLRKPLSKTDVVYETEKIEGVGYQSTIKLPCLPGEWGDSMSWAGEAFAKKTDAEHSAASIACAALKDYTPPVAA